MKKISVYSLCLLLLFSFASCGKSRKDITEWNGEKVYDIHVSMAFDETDMFSYVGLVDYVFVGTVTETVKNITADGELSQYKVQVVKNIKGNLSGDIFVSKHGGLDKKGTMHLYCSDKRKDTQLPESGKTYMFLAYAQSDGSLILSEFLDNSSVNDDLIKEYENYFENQTEPYERERFKSYYEK